jgi:GNAT superfamily N-acetyltransferase
MATVAFMLRCNIMVIRFGGAGGLDLVRKSKSANTLDPLADDGLVRKLWLGEADKYRDHLLRLDRASRHSRFGGGVSDEFISTYATTTFALCAAVHGYFVDGTLRGAAELRPLGPALARQAEAAFSIEAPWQSHGVGSALLARTLLAARNRGIRRLHMACLANNHRMQELARKFDAELTFDFGSVVGEVAAARPTPLSMLREMVVDGHGFATAVLDVQSRLLKPV